MIVRAQRSLGLLLAGLGLVASCGVLPEYSEGEGPAPAAACRIGRVGLRAGAVYSWDGLHGPECSVDADGAAHMTFDVEPGCPVDPQCSGEPECPFQNRWRSCVVATHHDLVEFASKRSVYGAELCVDGPLPGALLLKFEYDPDEMLVARRQITLKAVQDWEVPASGCFRVAFRAEDLSSPEHCPRRSAQEFACLPEDAPSRSVPELDLAQPTPKDAQILLTAEACSENKAPKLASKVAITLHRLLVYPESCFCQTSAACAADHYCDRDSWPDAACCRCSSDCTGVCHPLH